MAYSEHDRAAALAALETNEGSLKLTARQMGMSTTTLRRWRDEQASPDETGPLKKATGDVLPAARESIADRLREFVHAALDMAPDKLHDANLQQSFTAIGISIDKAQLLQGKPTEIGHYGHDRTEVPERALEAAATALRRRGIVN